MNKKVRKRLLITAIIVFALIANMIYFVSKFEPNPEEYDFACKDSVLIDKLIEFKNSNLEYSIPKELRLPTGSTTSLPDGYIDKYIRAFYFYAYLPNPKQIALFLVVPKNQNTCGLYFKAVNEGLTLSNWKLINTDYNGKESSKEEEIVELNVLDKLGIKYKKVWNIFAWL